MRKEIATRESHEPAAAERAPFSGQETRSQVLGMPARETRAPVAPEHTGAGRDTRTQVLDLAPFIRGAVVRREAIPPVLGTTSPIELKSFDSRAGRPPTIGAFSAAEMRRTNRTHLNDVLSTVPRIGIANGVWKGEPHPQAPTGDFIDYVKAAVDRRANPILSVQDIRPLTTGPATGTKGRR